MFNKATNKREKTKTNLVKMNERAINRLRRMKEIREAVEVSC